MKEEYLLTGPLEATNRPYALAKIAGIEMCWSYNRQYGTRFLAAMPTNLFGPGDNYDLEKSHVIPALIRKFHEAKKNNVDSVVVWGTGKPRREFLYSDDMAEACIFLMNLSESDLDNLKGSDEAADGTFLPPVINIGVGVDVSILELASIIKNVVAFDGRIEFDASKPDGTPQKLLDVSRLHALGWKANTGLREGIQLAYKNYVNGALTH